MSAIKVGDLVQVVKWPCCGRLLGHVFTVGKLWNVDSPHRCMYCGTDAPKGIAAVSMESPTDVGGMVQWLKRIPPLEELEGQNQKEDLREPA